ncbi:hypothetical protein V5O48_013560 [Marasmius crinis-equi]|uniref:Uncharacterized protein n=1 Tax=Marasmius crinis-equi TaxID=585013 RepID=A0ABR3EZR3_9AGAR
MPPRRIGTRGVKLQTPKELLPTTCSEQKEKKAQKELELAQQREEKEGQKRAEEEARAQKAGQSNERIASVEDRLALKEVKHQSLRPDLNVNVGLQATGAGQKNTGTLNTIARSRQIAAQKGGISVAAAVAPKLQEGEEMIKPEEDKEDALSNLDPANGATAVAQTSCLLQVDLDEFGDDIDELASDVDYVPSETDNKPKKRFSAADQELDSDAEKALVNDIDPELDDNAAYRSFLAMRNAAKVARVKSIKKKETQMKQKEVKNAQKSQVRNAVALARKVQPAPQDSRKRALSQSEDKADPKKSRVTEPKKRKAIELDIGGLRKSYQSIYQQASATSSRSSLQSEGSQSAEGEDLVGGVFDDDNDNLALAIARDAKKKRLEPESVYMQAIRKSEGVPANPVKLVAADVNDIDVKESTHTAPTQLQLTPRKTVSVRDLPISSADFNKNFLPIILDFVGTQENQFGISSNQDLLPFIRKQFNIIYPDHSPVDDALLKLVTRVVLGEI